MELFAGTINTSHPRRGGKRGGIDNSMNQSIKLGGVLVALALVIGACNGAGASPTPGATTAATTAPGTEAPTTEAPTTEAPATEAPTTAATSAPDATGSPSAAVPLEGTLTIWQTYGSGAGTEGAALIEALDLVRAENPGLTVDAVEVGFGDLFNTYQLQASSGEPDAFVAPNDSLGDLARAGLSQDLTDYFTDEELSRFSELAIDGSSLDGVLYQVPESLKAVAMYYNADTVATPPATTDELLAAVQGGTRVGLFGGQDGLYHNFGWWGAFGGELMDAEGNCIADETGVDQAFQFMVDLKDAGATFYTAFADLAAAFNAGELDIIVDGPWAAGGYAANVTNLGVAPMPAGPGGPALPLTGVDGWTINPNSDNVDLAVAFAKRMVEPDILAIFANTAYHIPADPSVASSDPISLLFADAVESGLPRPQIPELGGFWGNFGNAQAQILEADADPTTAVAEACTAMDTANEGL
jgi:arabinogalactan oligomer/maltooligosaccharide transport system substrate-binding protein